jgi:signal transduction histidine kinase
VATLALVSDKPVSMDSELSPHRGLGVERLIRLLPIRWRILAIAVLNTAVVAILASFIWNGAQVLSTAWDQLRQVRQSDRLLVSLESESGYLQSLIHRYFNQPNSAVSGRIMLLREALINTLKTHARNDPMLKGSVDELVDLIERFIVGFGDLREAHGAVARIYEQDVLKSAREITGLYAIVEGATRNRDALIWPALSKSRETFSAALVAANAYYFSLGSDSAAEAQKSLGAIERTLPVMVDLAENDMQRNALGALGHRIVALEQGLTHLSDNFATQARLLRDEIDGTQAKLVGVLNGLSAQVRTREQEAQERFDKVLQDVYYKVGTIASLALVLIMIVGTGIARSISSPLTHLRQAMDAIVSGDYGQRVRGLGAPDEIGAMARAIEVFRENAIAKRAAEDELRRAKERAEAALSELRETQRSLIDAERLAALGGLVAGVAHEVNNPVGISLTVASSLARRCEAFAKEIESGQIRRSRLIEFTEGMKDAASQLVGNLHRAGELIQSFKQVAVDRSHAERRLFDIRQSTEQIVSSLRPGLKNSSVTLSIDIPEGIILDSYPGPYGQVLTNLFLNAMTHAFADERGGNIRISGRQRKPQSIEIEFSDDGRGMSEEVQRRAFDPFFTTRRSLGGTGLGLHIVYNLVTRRLGGRIVLASVPGRGTRFTMTLPLTAPREEAEETADATVLGQ